MRALNARLQAAGVKGAACAADPGIAATGLNVQHDLARTLAMTQRGIADTVALHNQAATHASDASLPLALATLSGDANEIFLGSGTQASSLRDAAYVELSSKRAHDPIKWEERVVDVFWEQLVRILQLDEAAWGAKDEL